MIENFADRQRAGTVPAATGIVPRIRVGGGPAMAMWGADALEQRYLAGTNAVRTMARFDRVRVEMTSAAVGGDLALIVQVEAPAGVDVAPSLGLDVEPGAGCELDRRRSIALVCGPGNASLPRARRIFARAQAADRRWLHRSGPLGPGAPGWARRMYRRSLLTLRAFTDARTGAVAAGARDGWAYVWPRDASAVALALAASGYRPEARRIVRFLLGLDLGAAARFEGDGGPVPGRGPQGDAAGWAAVAARAAGFQPSAASPAAATWRDLPDYQEADPADYLANAIAATATSGVDGPEIRL